MAKVINHVVKLELICQQDGILEVELDWQKEEFKIFRNFNSVKIDVL